MLNGTLKPRDDWKKYHKHLACDFSQAGSLRYPALVQQHYKVSELFEKLIVVMLKAVSKPSGCWKENCMPVLPKLAKRGVFGKNAILEMSLNPRKSDGCPVSSAGRRGPKWVCCSAVRLGRGCLPRLRDPECLGEPKNVMLNSALMSRSRVSKIRVSGV